MTPQEEKEKPQGEVSKSMGVDTKPAHNIQTKEGYWILVDPKMSEQDIWNLKMTLSIMFHPKPIKLN